MLIFDLDKYTHENIRTKELFDLIIRKEMEFPTGASKYSSVLYNLVFKLLSEKNQYYYSFGICFFDLYPHTNNTTIEIKMVGNYANYSFFIQEDINGSGMCYLQYASPSYHRNVVLVNYDEVQYLKLLTFFTEELYKQQELHQTIYLIFDEIKGKKEEIKILKQELHNEKMIIITNKMLYFKDKIREYSTVGKEFIIRHREEQIGKIFSQNRLFSLTIKEISNNYITYSCKANFDNTASELQPPMIIEEFYELIYKYCDGSTEWLLRNLKLEELLISG